MKKEGRRLIKKKRRSVGAKIKDLLLDCRVMGGPQSLMSTFEREGKGKVLENVRGGGKERISSWEGVGITFSKYD